MEPTNIFLALSLVLASSLASSAQVGIGTSSPNAALDVTSTTNGFLPPRMTYAQRQAISSPATGLMIYCTDCGTGEPQYYNGSAWLNMIGGIGLTQPPTIGATTAASNIQNNSVTSGGNITNDNGLAITARGVCWSISSNPTTADAKTIESGTTGSFTSDITGLTRGTLYYMRSYAINAGGTSYGVQESFTTTAVPYVGESYQGGIIAYILQSGDPGYDPNTIHGLIATVADVSAGTEWGCMNTVISGADGTAIGTGNQNTIDIMTGCATAGIAARLCGDLVEGGYSDWYLPSKDELNKVYLNRVAVGGFSTSQYWSSSEFNSGFAWQQNFTDGSQVSGNGKSNQFRVRAIRAF